MTETYTYSDLIDPSPYRIVDLMYEAVQHDYLSLLNYLMDNLGAVPSLNDNYLIRIASREGYLDIVNRLLQDSRVNPSTHRSNALSVASSNGYLGVVNRLLRDPRVNPNNAIESAVRSGSLDIINAILNDPRTNDAFEVTSQYYRSITYTEKHITDVLRSWLIAHDINI